MKSTIVRIPELHVHIDNVLSPAVNRIIRERSIHKKSPVEKAKNSVKVEKRLSTFTNEGSLGKVWKT